ncbi:MAG: hypothetical protein NTY19_45800 [Planctomycetota bacterium]|nr:hypothetical protein [Planctomycetota bacterium]
MKVTLSLVRKCIVGLVLGGIGGFICAVLCIILLFALDSTTGGNTGSKLRWLMWVVLFGGPIVGVLIRILREFMRQQAELMAQNAAEAQRREATASRQRALAGRLSTLLSQSTTSAGGLPALLFAAETALDRAEREFHDGAFAPFWDAVEDAANALARFSGTVDQLIGNAQSYKTHAAVLPSPLPPFRLGVHSLPDASGTATRMRGIVRQSQKNYQFASIYEQRKTNQLLVAGFSTLGQAINELGDRLHSSLEALGSSVNITIECASEEASRKADALREQMQRDSEDRRTDERKGSEERRSHERQQREMLDNIQRRRKPLP